VKSRIPLSGFVLAALALASVSASVAQTLPELFGKVKAEVKSESWADALKTLDALEAEAAKPGNESAQKQLAGPLAFYRGVCSANLGQKDEAAASFSAFLKLQPNATIDAAVYSKKAVAAFERAQKDAAARAPSIAEAYKEFQPAADAKETDPADQYWGDGPARWILTDSEKATWSALADPNARVAFVEQFWTARASLPGSDGRTYREEFERRVAFADAKLAEDEEQRGSLTDRGMVFVLLGPPTYAGRKPMRTGDDKADNAGLSTVTTHDVENTERGMWAAAQARGARAPSSARLATANAKHGGPGKLAAASGEDRMEVWHYRKELLPKKIPYQQVDFEFVTKKGYGTNVLQRGPETVNTLGAAAPPLAPLAASQAP
jgi:GWxTD domain-containing protein